MMRNFVIYSVLCISRVLSDAATDYNEINSDGSFSFGLSNDDIGGHYHTAAGSPNKIIRGRYGSRNPATGRIEETVYTAGPRGFRARGPSIHRNMDLSQYPRGPIGTPDDPLADPYDDPSYDFSYRTAEHERREEADSTGRVRGLYSYLDDIGERHTVRYAAGAGTGFEVLNSVPDTPASVAYNSPLYKAPRKTRGRMSVQRGPDGQYKFILSGPDQRRSETSGPDGVVRGSYSYLDDKGIQRTVQYIAGAGIGYRVVQNVVGPGTHVSAGAATGPSYGIRDFQDNDLSDDGYLRTAESGRFRPKDISFDNSDGEKDNIPFGPDVTLSTDNARGDFGRPRVPGSRRPGISKPIPRGERRMEISGSRKRPDLGYGKDFGDFDLSAGSRRDGLSSEGRRPGQSGVGSRGREGGSPFDGRGDLGDDRRTSPGTALDGKDRNSLSRNRSKEKTDLDSSDRDDSGGGYARGYEYGKGVGGSVGEGGPGIRGRRPDFLSRDYDNDFSEQRPGFGPSRDRGSYEGRNREKDFSSSRGRKPTSPYDESTSRGGVSGSRRTGGSRVNLPEDSYESDFPLVTNDKRRLEIDRGRDWSARGRDSTLIKNVGKWYVGLPPGSAVRAHVQSIDLLPLGGRAIAPSEALLRDELKTT